VPGLVPSALVLLFALWCGTFAGGAGWGAAAAGQLAVLALAAAAGREWRDPWRLGAPGLLLPWALVAAAALAWWLSPVPRAGRVGLALLPAFLLLPAAVARAWRSGAARRWGARGLSAAVALVAGGALALWLAGSTPRPSLPLGQHLHLTAWLVLLLPPALLPWREGGPWRLLAGAAGLLGVAAVLGGRSLAGGLALALQGALALGWWGGAGGGSRRRALGLAAAGLLAAGLLVGPGLVDVLRGRDPSLDARRVYWRAGWDGVRESPAVGLGPGATAWTLAAFLRPEPGVDPPGEVVGELHLLPLALAYELGVPGALLAAAAAALFALRRRRDRRSAADRGLLGTGLLGLAGGAVVGLATADWRVAALPVAAAVAAGAALAGGRPAPAEASPPPAPGGLLHRARWAPAVYALAAAVVLVPLDLAHRAYDRAVDAPREVALRELDRAVARDPAFPLYRARRAWLRGESAAGLPAAAGALEGAAADALTAAEAAVGVAPLWLAAGSLAALVDRSRAAAALERACGLEPLGALAPFSLLEIASPLHQPLALGARSLAAEPRLAAATYWQGRPELLRRSVLSLAATQGIDEGWRAELVARVAALEAEDAAADRIDELALAFDPRPAGSVALHAFRRSPWAARLVFIPVRAGAAAGLAGLPPATALAGTDPRLFPPTCTGAFAPQELRKTLWKSR
jgi:O-antigen ligase